MFNKNQKIENNSWKGYTDLLTGLLMVFILISIVAFNNIKDSDDCAETIDSLNLVNDSLIGLTEATIEQYEMIKKIDSTFNNLSDNSLFLYNDECNQFELAVDIMFGGGGKTNIPDEYKSNLIKAGEELTYLLSHLHDLYNVQFSVIIEGRAAKHLDLETPEKNALANKRTWESAMIMSYKRAYQLRDLWLKNNIIKPWQQEFTDISIAGSGFEGNCRYAYEPGLEEKNKRFIVKVIPRFSPNFFEITNNIK